MSIALREHVGLPCPSSRHHRNAPRGADSASLVLGEPQGSSPPPSSGSAPSCLPSLAPLRQTRSKEHTAHARASWSRSRTSGGKCPERSLSCIPLVSSSSSSSSGSLPLMRSPDLKE